MKTKRFVDVSPLRPILKSPYDMSRYLRYYGPCACGRVGLIVVPEEFERRPRRRGSHHQLTAASCRPTGRASPERRRQSPALRLNRGRGRARRPVRKRHRGSGLRRRPYVADWLAWRRRRPSCVCGNARPEPERERHPSPSPAAARHGSEYCESEKVEQKSSPSLTSRHVPYAQMHNTDGNMCARIPDRTTKFSSPCSRNRSQAKQQPKHAAALVLGDKQERRRRRRRRLGSPARDGSSFVSSTASKSHRPFVLAAHFLSRARVSPQQQQQHGGLGLGCTVVSRGADRVDGGGVERGGRGDRVAGAERPGDPPRRQAGGLDARGRARRRRAEARGRDEERRDGARRGGRPGEGARRERAAVPLPRRPEAAAVRRRGRRRRARLLPPPARDRAAYVLSPPIFHPKIPISVPSCFLALFHSQIPLPVCWF